MQGYTNKSKLDTDNTLSANSDIRVPSQKAVKHYIDNTPGVQGPQGYQGDEGSQGPQGYQGVAGTGSSSVIITPSEITSNQNNYNPTDFSTSNVIRLSGNSSIVGITGFSAGSSGQKKTLVNVGSYPIYLAPQHPDSTAANRLIFHRDFILYPKTSVDIIYDDTLERWVIIGSETSYSSVVKNSFSAGSVTAGDWGNVGFLVINSGSNTSVAASGSLPSSFSSNTLTTTNGGGTVYMAKNALSAVSMGGCHIIGRVICYLNSSLSDGTDTYTTFFRLTPNVTTAGLVTTNTIEVVYDTTLGTTFYGKVYDGSSNLQTVDLGVTVAQSVFYNIVICVNKSLTEVRYYINDEYRGRVNTGLPASAGAGLGNGILKSAGATTRTMRTCFMELIGIY